MPAGAGRLVACASEAAPRVGLVLGSACGRLVDVTCTAVRRAATVELTTGYDVWADLDCGLPGTCLLLVPGADTVALADLVMGGTGTPEARAVTRLEQQVAVRTLVASLAPVVEALADWGLQPLTAGPPSDEPLPPGTGEVVAVVLAVALPSGTPCTVTLCLPARALLPVELDATVPAPATAAERALSDVPLSVVLRLPATTVVAADVADLAPGDVLRMDADAASQLSGCVSGPGGEDLTVLSASLGTRGRSRAVVVHELLGGL